MAADAPPLRPPLDPAAREVDIFRVGLSDEDAERLADQLTESKVELLRLHSNAIGTRGARAIANALSHAPVRKLVLSNNPIGDGGACAIALALCGSSLESLFLDDCGITDLGAEALADAIRNDCPLTEIYLDNNPIGDRGLAAIAAAVEESSSLSWLFLDQSALSGHATRYTQAGVGCVRRALTRSTSIQAVRMSIGADSWLQTEPQLGSATRLRQCNSHLLRCAFLLACERAAYGTRASRLSLLPVDVLALILGRPLPRRQRKRSRDTTVLMFCETRTLRGELKARAHRRPMVLEHTRYAMQTVDESVHG